MGIFDELKHKAEELGDKAKEGLGEAVDKAGDLLGDAKDKAGDLLEDARDKAGDLVEDVRERVGGDHGDAHAPTSESDDIGPDSSATDAVEPGYVTGEDAADDDLARGDADDAAARAEETGEGDPDGLVPDADVAASGPAASDTAAAELAAPVDAGTATDGAADVDVDEPLEPVARDVDPYAEPLSESIGAEIADSDVDRETLTQAVDPSDER